jgi:hypothetical protein
MNLESLGKIILLFALILFIVGGLLFLFGKVLGLGRLPGDILMRRGNVTVYIPLGTAIIISIIVTLLLNLIFFLIRR